MCAQALAEAAAALKRAEMKKIKDFQTKSALAMEQEEKKHRENELALERKKREEEAHLEFLRAEREAVVTATLAKAIDEELRFEQEEYLSHLPIKESSNRVREFISSQLRDVNAPINVKPQGGGGRV